MIYDQIIYLCFKWYVPIYTANPCIVTVYVHMVDLKQNLG